MHSPRLRPPLIRRGCEMPSVWWAVVVPLVVLLLQRFGVVRRRAGIDLRVVIIRWLDFATHQDREVRVLQP